MFSLLIVLQSQIMDVLNIDSEHISRKGSEMAAVAIQSPVLVVLAIWSLFRMVGLATLGGILVMFANTLIHQRLIAISFRLYHQQRDLLDERMGLTHEIITFIRWVKLLAYERMFEKKMSEKREEELKVVRRRQVISAITWALFVFLATDVVRTYLKVVCPQELERRWFNFSRNYCDLHTARKAYHRANLVLGTGLL